MDKNAIKKYAVWARNELIEKVTQKAQQYEIEDGKTMDPNASSVNGIVLSDTQKKQRKALIEKVNQDGFTQVMEEVAYTWFNRFIALRFMEVNGYLPSHVRIFTDENNNFKPQILSEAIHLDIDGLDMEKVYAMKEANQDEELFKYLLITQCNALNSILPGMFQKIEDYTELLLPDYLLREGSVIEQMITMIPEEDWTDQVQIIGWLYQYYNSEPKDQVFADLKKNKKITKEKIPAATQLFTPDWIVRYMVENSLGRLWLEGHPSNKNKFLPTKEEQNKYIETHEDDGKWHYYLEEAEQEPEVQKQLDEIHKEYSALKPEDILCIDPCQGSGHILCYLFDTLIKIYEDYGYTARDAASKIVENNIWGLDIDERASQLAYFSVMMKARQYDRRFFTRGVQPHVYPIVESNYVDSDVKEYFINNDSKLKIAIETLISEMHDAEEYGSIINVSMVDFEALFHRCNECNNEISLFHDQIQNIIVPLINAGRVLAQKYNVIVTNPPYMGSSGMGHTLSSYIKKVYPDAKLDMSTVFMEKALEMGKKNALVSMINIPVWMFLTSYENFRNNLLNKNTFINMLHLGRGIFGSDFGTTSFVIIKNTFSKYKGHFRKLFKKQGAVDSVEKKEKWFFDGIGDYKSYQNDFYRIPGRPIAYWVSEEFRKCFNNSPISSIAHARLGMATANNDKFLRLWHEVDRSKIGFMIKNREDAIKSGYKWFPYNKGGEYRKWYGNRDYIVNWEHDGYEIRNFKDERTGKVRSHNYNLDYIFQSGITWTFLSSSKFSARYFEEGFLCDAVGCGLYTKNNLNFYVLALLCSKVTDYILNVLNPSISYQPGNIASIPLCLDSEYRDQIESIARENISLSKEDWDSFETSWQFNKHPFINACSSIADAFYTWKKKADDRFYKLKANEEKSNRIFALMYGLNKDISFEVNENDVTVRKADAHREVRSFISYSVGCMFGRYSLDVDGLAYAGGDWDASKYKTFIPDKDNIIPITDDEYFTDDIVGRFVEFVKVVYGADTLEENLKFIADALGDKGTPREVIRNYFLNDFYKDHCKTYQKRPIYWLFDSGKKNGFKCLIYMHRYQPDTIARIRTDYVHEQQSRYRTAIEETEKHLQSAEGSNKVKLSKQLKKLRDQDEELHTYEEKIHHLADQMISIDLDEGVKHNYAIFQDVLAKIK